MPRVFISHSSQDRETVEREIIAPLRQHGVEPWYSKDSIETASEWEKRIREGLKSCDWFLIVLSPHSVASDWVKSEVDWALSERRDRVIPVMIETCDPSDLHLRLRLIQQIDFRQGTAQSLDRLLAVWGLDKASQVKSRHRAAQEALAGEDWLAAVGHLEAVLRLDPAHASAASELEGARRQHALSKQYAAGLAHLRDRRWREAIEALEQVRREEWGYKDVAASVAEANAGLAREEAERLFHRALGAAAAEDWHAAIEQLQAVLRLDPSHDEARSALGRAQQRGKLAELYAAGLADLKAGRWREALKSLRRVRSLDRNYKGVADLIAEADAGLAEEEGWQGEWEEEGRREEEAAPPEPPRPDFYREALDAIGREDWRVAREKLQAARAINPNDETLAAKLAEVDRRERSAAVLKDGLCYLEAKDWAAALEAFRRVQSAEGHDEGVAALIARAEANLKRSEEAKEEARQEEEERRRREAETEAGDGRWPKVSLKTAVFASVLLGSLLLAGIAYSLWGRRDGPGNNRAASQSAPSNLPPSSAPTPHQSASPGLGNSKPRNAATPQEAGPKARPTRQDHASQNKPDAPDASGSQQAAADEPPPPPPPQRTAPVSGDVLNGKVISKPQPPYPPIAKAARASGTVTVQILVDETGRVVSASAVSGHPLLREAAVAAARQARFSPTLLSGQPVKVSGVLTYNFVLQE